MLFRSVLDEILSGVKEDLIKRQEKTTLENLKEIVSTKSKAIDPFPIFEQAGVAVIAEVKRSSPSKGDLSEITDPALLAKEYELGGASCISVLTEERRFKGSLNDLIAVRKSVEIPVLRKDFIFSSYQLWEAQIGRAHV